MTEARSIVDNLRVMAIDNCMSKGMRWYAEKAYRHYSTTYFTPLHEAKKILTPFEAILIKMEDEMNEIPDEELQELKVKILEIRDRAFMGSAEEQEEAEPLSDDDWIAMQDKLVREQEAKVAAKKDKSVKDAAEKVSRAAGSLADTLKAVQEQFGRDIEKDLENPLTFPKENNKS